MPAANKRGCCTTQYSQNFDDKDKFVKMQNIDYQIQKLANSNLQIIKSNKNELCNKHKRYSKCGYACSLKHLESLHTFPDFIGTGCAGRQLSNNLFPHL